MGKQLGPAALAAILISLIGVRAEAKKSSACDCKDVAAIRYRIKELRTLIPLYEAEIARLGDHSPPFSLSAYLAFEGQQQGSLNALKKANPGSPSTFAGRTDPTSCNSEFPARATPCLRAALEIHEGHHSAVCSVKNGSGPGGVAVNKVLHPLTDYRDGGPLSAGFAEEVVCYRLELDWLTQQLDAMPKTCKPGWVLTFQVQVRGEGARRRSSWKIDHSYSGTVRLPQRSPLKSVLMKMAGPKVLSMKPEELMAIKQRATEGATWTSTSIQLRMQVEVTDKWTSEDDAPGEGDSFENTKRTQTWTGKGPDTARAVASFDEDTTGAVYNVDFSILPSDLTPSLTHTTQDAIDRSKYGYGDAPTHEEPEAERKREPFSQLKIPTVEGLLENGRVHHAVDRPLENIESGFVVFDSGWINPKPLTEPFKSWAQADRNLKVRIYYRLYALE